MKYSDGYLYIPTIRLINEIALSNHSIFRNFLRSKRLTEHRLDLLLDCYAAACWLFYKFNHSEYGRRLREEFINVSTSPTIEVSPAGKAKRADLLAEKIIKLKNRDNTQLIHLLFSSHKMLTQMFSTGELKIPPIKKVARFPRIHGTIIELSRKD